MDRKFPPKKAEFEKLKEEINILKGEKEIRKMTTEFNKNIGNDLEGLKSDANGGRRKGHPGEIYAL